VCCTSITFSVILSFYGRHEHLYERLEHCFIRSDLFNGGQVNISRLLLDTRVVLCTLSMLSHPELNKFANVVPLHTVIFDEASQIEVGDYLPLLHRFQHCLQKLVFIGDDKQRESWVLDLSTRVTDLDLSGAIRP
jgi:hypothetical protein